MSSPNLLHAEIQIRSGKALVIFEKRVCGLREAGLDRFVRRARKAVGLDGIVNVLVTTSAKMRGLNQTFRGKNKPTDVLSFPAALVGVQDATRLAGEIAISAEIAVQNAVALQHSPSEEVKILALHGLLHLAGFDHERDDGEMSRREIELRRKLRLPAGLIERATKSQKKIPSKKYGRLAPARRSR